MWETISSLVEMLCYAQLLSHVRLFVILWTVAHQAPLSMEFSRQEYQSGLPCPPPGDLPNPGIKLRSPALQVNSLQSELLEHLKELAGRLPEFRKADKMASYQKIHKCMYMCAQRHVCVYTRTYIQFFNKLAIREIENIV